MELYIVAILICIIIVCIYYVYLYSEEYSNLEENSAERIQKLEEEVSQRTKASIDKIRADNNLTAEDRIKIRTQLKEDRDKLKSEYNQLYPQTQKLTSQVTQLKINIQVSKDKKSSLDRSIAKLSKQKLGIEQDIKSQRDDLKDMKSTLETKISSLTKSKATLNSKKIKLEATLKSSNVHLSALEADIKDINNSHAKIELELTSAHKKLSSINLKLTETKTNYKSSIAINQSKIHELDKELLILVKERNVLKSEIKELESELLKASTKLAGVEYQTRELKEYIDNMTVIVAGVNCKGHDISYKGKVKSASDCGKECSKHEGCLYSTYDPITEKCTFKDTLYSCTRDTTHSTIFRTSKGEEVSNLLAKVEPTREITDEEALAFFSLRNMSNAHVVTRDHLSHAKITKGMMFPNQNNPLAVPDEATCAKLAIKNGMTEYSYDGEICAGIANSRFIHNTLTTVGIRPKKFVHASTHHLYPYNIPMETPNSRYKYFNKPLLGLSLRKVNHRYFGPCVRLRAISDTTGINMKDFRFDPIGKLDIEAIKEWNPKGEKMFVHTWYDQGYRNHMVMPLQDYQPELIMDEQPFIRFNGKVGLINTQFDPYSHWQYYGSQTPEFTMVSYHDTHKHEGSHGVFCNWGVDKKKNSRMKIAYGGFEGEPHDVSKLTGGSNIMVLTDDNKEVSYRSSKKPKTNVWHSIGGINPGFQKMLIKRYSTDKKQVIIEAVDNINTMKEDLYSNIQLGETNMDFVKMDGVYNPSNGKLYGTSGKIKYLPNQIFSLGCDVEDRSLKVKDGFKGDMKELIFINAGNSIRRRHIKRILESIDIAYELNYMNHFPNRTLPCNRSCMDVASMGISQKPASECASSCENNEECWYAIHNEGTQDCTHLNNKLYPKEGHWGGDSDLVPSVDKSIYIKNTVRNPWAKTWTDIDLRPLSYYGSLYGYPH